jgi:divalent metal cation (Fe/Co/Zn/Cd) transporter
MEGTALTDRAAAVGRGRTLEYFTIAWNSLEGIVALVAGWMAGSIALVGFGVDSVIEVTSGATLLCRMGADLDLQRRERNEKRALTIVGLCFLALAAYVGCESVWDLFERRAPERSLVGIALACVSLVVMPLLSRAKRKVGNALASSAMKADAKQTEFCAYLSAILLGGLLLNALFGFWWADAVAALVMVPIIANEGIQRLRGETCDDWQ